jgi:hypothetical protein
MPNGRVAGSLVLVVMCTCLLHPSAQTKETFTGALAPMPAGAIDATTMIGTGSVTAVFDGRHLEISGAFENLASPATVAQIRHAKRGTRGSSIASFDVPRAPAGKFEAHFTLTPLQVQDLKNGWLYVQIGTERHADGQVRAWLIASGAER